MSVPQSCCRGNNFDEKQRHHQVERPRNFPIISPPREDDETQHHPARPAFALPTPQSPPSHPPPSYRTAVLNKEQGSRGIHPAAEPFPFPTHLVEMMDKTGEAVKQGEETTPETTTPKEQLEESDQEPVWTQPREVHWIDWLCETEGDSEMVDQCCGKQPKKEWCTVHALFIFATFFGVFAVGIMPILTVTTFSPGMPLFQRNYGAKTGDLSFGSDLEVSLGTLLFSADDHNDGESSWLALRECKGSVPQERDCSGRSSKCSYNDDFSECDFVNSSMNPFRSCPELQTQVHDFARWHFAGGVVMVSQSFVLSVALLFLICCGCKPSVARFLSYLVILPLDLLLVAIIMFGNIASMVKIGNTPCHAWGEYSPGNGPTLLSSGSQMGWSGHLILRLVFTCAVLVAVVLGIIILIFLGYRPILKERRFRLNKPNDEETAKCHEKK